MVYMAARNEIKARNTIHELLKDTGKEAIFLKLDLASLESVREAATEFKRFVTNRGLLFLNLSHNYINYVAKKPNCIFSSTTRMIFSYLEHAFDIITHFSGVMWPPLQQISADGYDLQFATNVMGIFESFKFVSTNKSLPSLGHFLLTHLLLANLKAGAKSLRRRNAASSISHLGQATSPIASIGRHW